jgi:hypothetical protein
MAAHYELENTPFFTLSPGARLDSKDQEGAGIGQYLKSARTEVVPSERR